MFTNLPKYCFNTSNGTEFNTVSPTETTVCFNPPGIRNTPTLTSSKPTQNRNTPFATEARVAQRFFLLVGQMP